MTAIILFDGICNFCSGSVQFIIKRDPQGYFRFASLQGEVGQSLLEQYHVPTHMDSLVLIENNKIYVKSDAALRICKHLKGAWKLLYLLRIVPKFMRDAVYAWIARNRYTLWGKKESCMIPSQDIRERFLKQNNL